MRACCNILLIFIVKCGALSISIWQNFVVLSKFCTGIVSLSFLEYPDSQLEWFRWELCIMGAVLTCPKNHVPRVQMDAEGYVHLNVIGRFNRVRALTQDVELIKEVNPANYPVCMYVHDV